MTGNLSQRLRSHSWNKPWWSEVAAVTEQPVPGHYTDVLKVERLAIAKEHPRYNVRDRAPAEPVPTPDGLPLFIALDKSPRGHAQWFCTICKKVLRCFDLDRCRIRHGHVDELS